ncbi:hypothetical protein PR048_010285 [Dryococelus australis]|uniref:Uncharacterized protein n=1 Tax=Dryococelus australis TaxID=614101 RepID=A0ABQ9I2C1_9NEOP|nr:hypothetical protein PR048_010285 [Dryococelus australis]
MSLHSPGHDLLPAVIADSSMACLKIQITLLGKCQVVVCLDVVTLLAIWEIETREYLSMFFPDCSKFPNEFSKWVEFCKRKEHHFLESDFDETQLMTLKLMHGEKLKGTTLNPSATQSVRKYNLPSSDREDAKCPDTVTSNLRAVRYEAKRWKELVEVKRYTADYTQNCNYLRNIPTNESHDNTNHNIEIHCELGSECYQKYCTGINVDTKHEVTVMDKDTLNESLYEPDESQVDSCNEKVDLSSYSQPGKKPEKYFIVAWSCLLALLKICNDCKNEISNMSYYCKRAMICIKITCACGECIFMIFTCFRQKAGEKCGDCFTFVFVRNFVQTV